MMENKRHPVKVALNVRVLSTDQLLQHNNNKKKTPEGTALKSLHERLFERLDTHA